jgi:peptidoglycan/xylan/chitin deacetylase (PgdA/CDA1 family)
VDAVALFGRLLAPRALARSGKRPPRWLSVLSYHRVVPTPPPDYPFDREVIDCDPREFARHMELVARLCTPVGLDEVLEHLERGRRLPPNPVLVTFDDGYRDNREHAQPILDRLGVPACFFVTTGNISQRKVFWWDRVAYLFHQSRVSTARLTYPIPLLLHVRGDGGRSRRTVLRLIKSQPGLDLERFLGHLARALRVDWDGEHERRAAEELLMTWDDVLALAAAGMEIGSHTRTHRVLYTVPPGELAAELAGSRDDIAVAIGRPPRAISYPVGHSLRRMPALLRAVREAGYRAGFTCEPRANPLAGRVPLDPCDLARLPVDIVTRREQLGSYLAAPELCPAW